MMPKALHNLYTLFSACCILVVGLSCKTAVNQPNQPLQQRDTADVTVTVQTDHPLLSSNLKLGVTYMQYNLNPWGDADAIARGKALLQDRFTYHAQHIFGFGVGSPEPLPGDYHWVDLDSRMALAEELGGTPVITLATAPTWMTDPDWEPGLYPDETDWSKIERAPLPEHVDAFASLCARIAARYPQVTYFQVWNELKGMWHPTENRWDYERYTALYNTVYDSVKHVRPDAQLGGPYVVMDTWKNPSGDMISDIQSPEYGTLDKRVMDVVTYWLRHRHGGEFLVVDGGVKPKDANDLDPIQATKKFHDVSLWLKSQTTLPLWWAEDYVNMTSDMAGDTLRQAPALACMLAYYTLAGVDVSLRWAPEAQGDKNEMNLFSSTQGADGGRPFNNYFVYRDFGRHFPVGTPIYAAAVSKPAEIMVLASDSAMMLVNKVGQEKSVSINGSETFTLQPYQVFFGDLP